MLVRGQPWEVHSRWLVAPTDDREDVRSLTVLTLTNNASIEIRNLIDDPEVPEGCGVRIAPDPTSGDLTLSMAVTPAEDDQVIDDAGARVFLEPHAAALLEDKALDASTDGAGQVRFMIADLAG
jgi:Fe-S cluster assembly iron-binding protein IscA